MDPEARASFYDLLGFYRLLIDLQEHGSLSSIYVSARFKAGCTYLVSAGGKATTKYFAERQTILESVINRISQECEGKK